MTSKIRDITSFLCVFVNNRRNRRNRFLCNNNYYYYFSLLVYVIIIVMILIIIIAITIISNGNRGEWSTIEGVIGRVISNQPRATRSGTEKEIP